MEALSRNILVSEGNFNLCFQKIQLMVMKYWLVLLIIIFPPVESIFFPPVENIFSTCLNYFYSIQQKATLKKIFKISCISTLVFSYTLIIKKKKKKKNSFFKKKCKKYDDPENVMCMYDIWFMFTQYNKQNIRYISYFKA